LGSGVERRAPILFLKIDATVCSEELLRYGLRALFPYFATKFPLLVFNTNFFSSAKMEDAFVEHVVGILQRNNGEVLASSCCNELYTLNLNFKPFVKAQGGLKKICSRHSEKLQFVDNVVRIADFSRGGEGAAAASSRGGEGAAAALKSLGAQQTRLCHQAEVTCATHSNIQTYHQSSQHPHCTLVEQPPCPTAHPILLNEDINRDKQKVHDIFSGQLGWALHYSCVPCKIDQILSQKQEPRHLWTLTVHAPGLPHSFTAEGDKKSATLECASQAWKCPRLRAMMNTELSKVQVTLDDAFATQFLARGGRVVPASVAAWAELQRRLKAEEANGKAQFVGIDVEV
jgi:hypothetical protein